MLLPNGRETEIRNTIVQRVIDFTERNEKILLPPFLGATQSSQTPSSFSSVGLEPNDFGSTVGDYRYQFEGEEDLLHLIVTRIDHLELAAEDGQAVMGFLLNGVPLAMIWIRPGRFSQHFFVGHDEVVRFAVRSLEANHVE